MYRLLLAVLLAAPVCANAQSLDLRGFGGVMMNSGTYQSTYGYEHSKLNALGGLGASYRAGRLDYGLNLSYRRYSFTKTIRYSEFDPATGYEVPGSAVTREAVFKEPAFAIAPSVNYHFGKRKPDWYAGLSPAYIRYLSVSPTSKQFQLSYGSNGFSLDARLGCNYEFIPRLRGFAEVTAGSVWMPFYRSKQQRFFNAGLNVGAQFRVWERSSKTAAAD